MSTIKAASLVRLVPLRYTPSRTPLTALICMMKLGGFSLGAYMEILCQTVRDTTGLEHGLTAVVDPHIVIIHDHSRLTGRDCKIHGTPLLSDTFESPVLSRRICPADVHCFGTRLARFSSLD